MISDKRLFSTKSFVQLFSDQLMEATVVSLKLFNDVFYRNYFFRSYLQVVLDAYIVDGADAEKFSFVCVHKLMVRCVTQCVTA